MAIYCEVKHMVYRLLFEIRHKDFRCPYMKASLFDDKELICTQSYLNIYDFLDTPPKRVIVYLSDGDIPLKTLLDFVMNTYMRMVNSIEDTECNMWQIGHCYTRFPDCIYVGYVAGLILEKLFPNTFFGYDCISYDSSFYCSMEKIETAEGKFRIEDELNKSNFI